MPMHFLKRSGMTTHSFTCDQATSAFTAQPQSITALWVVLILPSHGGQKAESTWVAGWNKVLPSEVEPGHGRPSQY